MRMPVGMSLTPDPDKQVSPSTNNGDLMCPLAQSRNPNKLSDQRSKPCSLEYNGTENELKLGLNHGQNNLPINHPSQRQK